MGPRIIRRYSTLFFLTTAILVFIVLSLLVVASRKPRIAISPVPNNISRAVSFPIYYPDQKKLPRGYTLSSNSFSKPVPNGVTYSVLYGHGQKIVFSLQPKPSNNELQGFSSNYIPLHNSYSTPIGQALLGAYNTKVGTETLVSLPTNSNTWIILTAPYNINQDELKQVLSSLTKD